MDNRVIDRIDVKDALERFAEEGGDRKALNDLANICRKDNNVLADRELMLEILKAAQGKTPTVTALVSHFVKGYVRASNNWRKTGRETIIDITGMKNSSYFSDKSPLDLDVSGDARITDKERVALYVIGPTFLEDTEFPKITPLGKDWDEAVKVSFAEEIGVADDRLFSLGRWYTTLAMNSRNTLSKDEAKIIIRDVQRINGIVDEHHYRSVRIPEFLYDIAGIDTPKANAAPSP